MLFWIFLVRCSSRSILIFLVVSKEIQKYDQRKFYFFSEKKNFRQKNSIIKIFTKKKFVEKFFRKKKIRNKF